MVRPYASNLISYVFARQIDDTVDYCKKLVNARFEASENLYKKDLFSHYGCVNAIEFSNEGDLVSGSDDFNLYMWNIPPKGVKYSVNFTERFGHQSTKEDPLTMTFIDKFLQYKTEESRSKYMFTTSQPFNVSAIHIYNAIAFDGMLATAVSSRRSSDVEVAPENQLGDTNVKLRTIETITNHREERLSIIT